MLPMCGDSSIATPAGCEANRVRTDGRFGRQRHPEAEGDIGGYLETRPDSGCRRPTRSWPSSGIRRATTVGLSTSSASARLSAHGGCALKATSGSPRSGAGSTWPDAGCASGHTRPEHRGWGPSSPAARWCQQRRTLSTTLDNGATPSLWP